MWNRIATASLFSLFYVSMYPVLTGGFVIYHYPYWPPLLALMYVLGGILLQAWFCFDRRRPAGEAQPLWFQVVSGIVYVAAIGVFPGSIYQS